MMARQNKMPRNLGEGLAAMGDAWADRSYYDKVNEDEAANRAYEAGQTTGQPEPATPPIVPYQPTPQAVVTAPQANATPSPPPATGRIISDNTGPQPGGRPLPVDQQQDPNSPVIRMPSAEATQSWRDSVSVPSLVPPRPQPGAGPRSDVAPSPTGAANIPPVNVAGLGLGGPPPQPQPFAPTAAAQPATGVISDAPPNEAARNNVAQQLAQNVFPPITGGGAATLPQGYKPPAPPVPVRPPVVAAPPVPQVRAEPRASLPPPTLQPLVNDDIRRLQNIVRDPRISDTGRAMVQKQIDTIQGQIEKANEQTRLEYNDVRRQRLEEEGKARDPATQQALEANKLTMQEARQRIKKGDEPVVRQDVETGLIYNPATGEYEQPKIAGGDNRKPVFKGTEFQGKTLVNSIRSQLAVDDLTPDAEKTLSSSPISSALGSVGIRSFQSQEYKDADTARENFVQAFIRQQSGAGFSAKELEAEARSMTPEYGDTEAQLSQKRAQRDAFVGGTRDVVGGANNQRILDQRVEEVRAEKAARKAAREEKKDPREQAADAEKSGQKVPEFANEADAAMASKSLPKNARGKSIVRINGRLAEID